MEGFLLSDRYGGMLDQLLDLRLQNARAGSGLVGAVGVEHRLKRIGGGED